jgi:hypothetical protein
MSAEKNIRSRPYAMTLLLWIASCCVVPSAFGISKMTTGSGVFSDPQIWTPAGVPGHADHVTISQGHVINMDVNSDINTLEVMKGSRLKLTPGMTLALGGNLTVAGEMDMNGGDISFTQGNKFTLLNGSSFTWNPGSNTQSGASLFTKGTEDFHEESELIITKWFNYSGVPLGSLVTGHFGNLTLNSFQNGLIFEWNQNNEFESHHVKGKLTIGQAWVVLDKSGSISNTTIGSIELNNVNSFLDLHNGDHPSSFSLQTDSIVNIGGTFTGIHNGNGDVNITVRKNLVNLGYMEIIYNSGVSGTGTGNATLQVDGMFEQFDGDFRGIFNLSTSTAGVFHFEAGEVKIHDGIFMGLYACHTSHQESVMNIAGDLVVNLNDKDSKFRGNGLNSLAGTKSNAGFRMHVAGDVIISGPVEAEFTSSGSGGVENIEILGTMLQSGGESNFNLGDHNTTIKVSGGITLNNGTAYLSRTKGSLLLEVEEDVVLAGGNMVLKASSGAGSITFHTELWITGGNLLFHDDMQDPTADPVYVKVFGDLFHTGGTLSFDNNLTGQPGHGLSLYGKRYITGGNATITTSLPPSANQSPTIFFDRQGELEYFENGNTHQISNVIQVISPGCSLKVRDGNLQCASVNTPNVPVFIIKENALTDLGSSSVYSNGKHDHALLLLNDGATMITSHPNGLMQENSSSAIDISSGMDVLLEPYSVVEYAGGSGQLISGNVSGKNAHNYGILRISLATPSSKAVTGTSEVVARKKLELEQGLVTLGSQVITLESGTPGALTTTGGSFTGADLSGTVKGGLQWLNIEPGSHVVPFSDGDGTSVNISFEPKSGFGNDLKVTTCETGPDNRPLPGNTTAGAVTHTMINGNDISSSHMIDRWFLISAQDITGDITLEYLPSENTMLPEISRSEIHPMVWKGNEWIQLNGAATATTEQKGSITINDNGTWGAICIVSAQIPGMADLLHFDAILNNNVVDIEWETKNGHEISYFEVLRSADGQTFSPNKTNIASVNSAAANQYRVTDEHPLKGTSYYKLKQVNKDGEVKFSQAVKVVNDRTMPEVLSFLNIGPNPFKNFFNATVSVTQGRQNIEMKLINLSGQEIFTRSFNVTGTSVNIEFSEGAGLPDGVYLLMATDGVKSIYHKMYKSS